MRFSFTVEENLVLPGFNAWTPLCFTQSSVNPDTTISHDTSTGAFSINNAGFYVVELSLFLEKDDKRVVGLQWGSGVSPSVDVHSLDVKEVGTSGVLHLVSTYFVEKPTPLRVWTSGQVETRVTNGGNLDRPTLRITKL